MQFANASEPILVTLFGKVILFRFMQFSKVLYSNLVMFSDKHILVKLEHPIKALAPMNFTLLGIVIVSRDLQSSKKPARATPKPPSESKPSILLLRTQLCKLVHP